MKRLTFGRLNAANGFVVLIAGSGLAVLILSALEGSVWTQSHLLMFLAIVAGMVLSELFVINLTVRRESMSFSMIEATMAVALMALPKGPFVLAVALGMLGGQVIRRRPLVKVAFNTGMYTLGAGAAATIFEALRSGLAAGPPMWLAAIAGMSAFYLLNQILLATVVSLFEGESFKSVLLLGGPILSAVWAGNLAFGILAHYLLVTLPIALVPLAFPFALSYAAYRAWINSKGESQKMRRLYDVGSTLIASTGTGTTEDFLVATKEMFRANGAELISFEQNGTLRVIKDNGKVEEIEGMGDLQTISALDAYVRSNNWRSYLLTPLVSEVGIIGGLVIHDHQGAEGPAPFPPQDQTLLQMLSNQTSVALRNSALFQSISEERTKLSDIVEHTSDGIYQASPERRIVTWNPAMESITGYSAAEAVGQMCFNVLRARNAEGLDMCSRDCPILAAGAHKCHEEREVQIMTKEGAARWIQYSHSPILDPAGVMTSDVVVVRDVTQQRASQELKDDFVATVSHELRTPLTPIKGFLETLMRSDAYFTPDEQRPVFEMMYRQTERLERLVDDLLDVSSLESGRVSVESETIRVMDVLDKIVEGYRASHPERRLRYTSSNPEVEARANPPRLEQVLYNLIQNAIRYSPETEPIDIIVREEDEEVTISIRDRGPGIPHDEQEAIFDRFYRSGHHLTREQGGTGLGLFISRRLTEAMGGRISLSSRLGQGSTFSVHLQRSWTSPIPAQQI